ncbi:strawberry notch-like NTP hydrolase domain-containing protein [Methylomicrobium sp. Wu6]|uniref:strawberry notch-like NTP hydrolase domain-containing protein n=1 Tax=Methylomicrobium sp. Wu6 TaxID=3107928 RepID=UPI002DD61D6D|nr:strawberry notch family protein [Methylomicrobium sp. Wu6]MEC4748589.1 strawberry notch family protein [Methylomicrobium sp. Wu6]
MAKQSNPDQWDLFDDWLVSGDAAVSQVIQQKETDLLTVSFDKSRYVLALNLAQKLDKDGEITTKFLTDEANRAFGGTQAEGVYSTKDAYDAMEAAFNIHLGNTEDADWNDQDAVWAKNKANELTNRIQRLPTQTRRDEEMDEFQQFSTPPALSFVANWVANVNHEDVMVEPSAGTGDLAIWSRIAGATVVLNELSPRRQSLLASVFPQARLFKENAEQLDNVLPIDIKPSVIVMNPPFSSTAGRVQGQRDTSNGARHIEQALKRLENRGRLVAIVGNGMAADRAAFSKWWDDIKKKYNVRANIGISGKEYAKYGTTFDNQILVIDKTGPTTQPVLAGKVESVAELPMLLESIRNERQRIESRTAESAGIENTGSVQDPIQSGNRISEPGVDTDGIGVESIGDGTDTGAVITDSQVGGESAAGNVVDDGIGAGSRVQSGSNGRGNAGGSSGDDTGRNSGITEGDNATGIAVEVKSGEVSEFTDSVFANYTPQRLTIKGAQPHPGKLVQSAAMSAVEPPAPSYAPVLPKGLVDIGLLSIAQLEAIVYAGQAHSELLPNGSRKGFFIGDGTGVGKGREISGIILDNMMQGRSKAVWVSFNEGLIEDARRDFAGVCGNPNKIFFQGKTKAGNEITQEDGILFTTYSTLRGGEKKQANDLGQQGGKTRAQQIIDWLGKDFDGVIAFDEAHSMGNAIAIKGKRGVKKPSQQAIAGINLQRELPNARITYVSATGATEISNLSYADRLGLWGEGTPFADTNSFITGVSKGGIASMELISRDMKAMGMYLARSLSYDGVSYERLEHTLSDLQEDIYNELAGAWQVVLNNVEQALEITQAGKNGNGKSAAMSQFWGAHQRFFNQIITAMQTPRVIDDIRAQLDVGNVAVIQLVNTNEAAQERIIADATANDAALEDLDFTPRQMLMDYVRNGFPVAAYEESKDENGNTVYLPVKDSEGNPVFDREAIALRDALLETLQQIRVPENPLDSIINAFGSDRVAEVTGRSRRFVQTRDEEGNLKVVEEKRGKNSSRSDAEAFQANKKDILIFSGAGGTGYSFHADNTAENQRKRIHYILQPGWRADYAVQGFGRTHRTNQAQEPHYVLPTTNLKAQKRFVSYCSQTGSVGRLDTWSARGNQSRHVYGIR